MRFLLKTDLNSRDTHILQGFIKQTYQLKAIPDSLCNCNANELCVLRNLPCSGRDCPLDAVCTYRGRWVYLVQKYTRNGKYGDEIQNRERESNKHSVIETVCNYSVILMECLVSGKITKSI